MVKRFKVWTIRNQVPNNKIINGKDSETKREWGIKKYSLRYSPSLKLDLCSNFSGRIH